MGESQLNLKRRGSEGGDNDGMEGEGGDHEGGGRSSAESMVWLYGIKN